MLFTESTHCSNQAFKTCRRSHVIVTLQLKGHAERGKCFRALERFTQIKKKNWAIIYKKEVHDLS